MSGLTGKALREAWDSANAQLGLAIETIAAQSDRLEAMEGLLRDCKAFADVAAGEGYELGGIDAADLYARIDILLGEQ